MGDGDHARTRGFVALVRDIAEGYLTLNPLSLKQFDGQSYKGLHQQIRKMQTEIRGEKFPVHDLDAIRRRNLRLQRLHQALVILEHQARTKHISLA